ncbi:MAG: ETC complex I subunit [Alphaproteobacteria bacterium]|nr:MAG: ETC complex I subunit [Alphaproteobacteria bacterium]
MAYARIYRPTKSAMQSGVRNTRHWVLEFDPEDRLFVEPLMGWTGSRDTRRQIRLRFPTRDDAVRYAQRHGLPFEVLPEHARRHHPRSYADNFK